MSEELEQLIRRQRLREPSPVLDGRIASALSTRRTIARRIYAIAGAAAAVIAASLLLIAGPLRGPGPAPRGNAALASNPDPFVRIDQVWSQMTPGDLLVTQDNQPVRPVVVQRLYHTQWLDEKDNVRIEMTVPEEQVVLVSASI